MIWIMIKKHNESKRFWYKKSVSPCYKGELSCCLLGLSVVLGWDSNNRKEK